MYGSLLRFHPTELKKARKIKNSELLDVLKFYSSAKKELKNSLFFPKRYPKFLLRTYSSDNR